MPHKLTPFDLALWVALPMAHTPRLEGRLRMILNTETCRILPRRAAALSLALAAVLLLPLAAARPVPADSATRRRLKQAADPTRLVAPGISQKDEAAEASGLIGKDLVAFKANMDEVRVYDKQIFGSKDVSAEEARRMTTRGLITQTSRLKLYLLLILHPDLPKIAMYRASRCSNSMAELLGRKDFTAAFLQAYSSFDPNPKTHSHFQEEGGLFATGWMLALQDHPRLRSQSAGHEKEILAVLCKDYRKCQKVNASYPKGQAPYGPTPFPLEQAQRFARRVFPHARIFSVRLNRGPAEFVRDVKLGIKELEQLCGT